MSLAEDYSGSTAVTSKSLPLPVTGQVMDGAVMHSDRKSHPPVSSPCSRFKTLMTNKSEQDGDNSKTIEISDMKYHIFQVGGSRCCTLWGAAASQSQPSTAARVLLHQWPGQSVQATVAVPWWGGSLRAWHTDTCENRRGPCASPRASASSLSREVVQAPAGNARTWG